MAATLSAASIAPLTESAARVHVTVALPADILRRLLDQVDEEQSLSDVLEDAAVGWIAELDHDLAVVEARRGQPSQPLEDVMREFEEEGLL